MNASSAATSLRMPDPIRQAHVAGAPMQYPWDLDVSDAIAYARDDEHQRLRRALWQTELRWAFGLLLATAEWVAWRYDGMVPLDDPLLRIEAGNAGLADPRYASIPEPGDDFPDDMQDAHGPLMLLRMLISDAWQAYVVADTAVYEHALSMAVLARHVLPNGKAFENWLSGTLARCARFAPRSKLPPEQQPAVARSFYFEGSAPWDAEAARHSTSSYLRALRPEHNPYLKRPEELTAQGWVGTPYQPD
jgi:hypothetical protein